MCIYMYIMYIHTNVYRTYVNICVAYMHCIALHCITLKYITVPVHDAYSVYIYNYIIIYT